LAGAIGNEAGNPETRDSPDCAAHGGQNIIEHKKTPADTHCSVGVISSEKSGAFLATGERANSIADGVHRRKGLELQALFQENRLFARQCCDHIE
jgi:hypothetical protein